MALDKRNVIIDISVEKEKADTALKQLANTLEVLKNHFANLKDVAAGFALQAVPNINPGGAFPNAPTAGAAKQQLASAAKIDSEELVKYSNKLNDAIARARELGVAQDKISSATQQLNKAIANNDIQKLPGLYNGAAIALGALSDRKEQVTRNAKALVAGLRELETSAAANSNRFKSLATEIQGFGLATSRSLITDVLKADAAQSKLIATAGALASNIEKTGSATAKQAAQLNDLRVKSVGLNESYSKLTTSAINLLVAEEDADKKEQAISDRRLARLKQETEEMAKRRAQRDDARDARKTQEAAEADEKAKAKSLDALRKLEDKSLEAFTASAARQRRELELNKAKQQDAASTSARQNQLLSLTTSGYATQGAKLVELGRIMDSSIIPASNRAKSSFQTLSDKQVDSAASLVRLQQEFSRTGALTGAQERQLRTLSTNLDGFGREVDRATNRMTFLNRSFTGLFEAQRGLRDIGTTLSVGLTAPLVGFGVASVSSAVQFDTFKRSIASLGGGTAAANAELEKLRQLAKLPGLTFSEAVEGAARLKSVGLEFSQINEIIKQFSNAVALGGGNADNFKNITVQLQQMSAAGKILNSDLKPILVQAPIVAQAVKNLYGTVTAGELSEKGITPVRFIADLTAELNKLPRAADGARNTFDNFKDIIFQALIPFGDAILSVLIPAIKAITPVIEGMSNVFKALPGPIQLFIILTGAAAAAIGPLLLVVGQLAGSAAHLIELWKIKAAVTAVDTVATSVNSLAQAAQAAAIGLNTIAQEGNVAATELDTASTIKNTVATAADTVAEGANTAATALNTEAQIASAGAEIGSNAARLSGLTILSRLTGLVNPYTLALAGLAATAWLVTDAVTTMNASSEYSQVVQGRAADGSNQLKAALSSQGKSVQELEQEVKELKNTYDQAQIAINGATDIDLENARAKKTLKQLTDESRLATEKASNATDEDVTSLAYWKGVAVQSKQALDAKIQSLRSAQDEYQRLSNEVYGTNKALIEGQSIVNGYISTWSSFGLSAASVGSWLDFIDKKLANTANVATRTAIELSKALGVDVFRAANAVGSNTAQFSLKQQQGLRETAAPLNSELEQSNKAGQTAATFVKANQEKIKQFKEYYEATALASKGGSLLNESEKKLYATIKQGEEAIAGFGKKPKAPSAGGASRITNRENREDRFDLKTLELEVKAAERIFREQIDINEDLLERGRISYAEYAQRVLVLEQNVIQSKQRVLEAQRREVQESKFSEAEKKFRLASINEEGKALESLSRARVRDLALKERERRERLADIRADRTNALGLGDIKQEELLLKNARSKDLLLEDQYLDKIRELRLRENNLEIADNNRKKRLLETEARGNTAALDQNPDYQRLITEEQKLRQQRLQLELEHGFAINAARRKQLEDLEDYKLKIIQKNRELNLELLNSQIEARRGVIERRGGDPETDPELIELERKRIRDEYADKIATEKEELEQYKKERERIINSAGVTPEARDKAKQEIFDAEVQAQKSIDNINLQLDTTVQNFEAGLDQLAIAAQEKFNIFRDAGASALTRLGGLAQGLGFSLFNGLYKTMGLIINRFITTGKTGTAVFKQLGAGALQYTATILQSLAAEQFAKAKGDVVEAIRQTAKGFGQLAIGNGVAATAHFKSAAGHALSAVKSGLAASAILAGGAGLLNGAANKITEDKNNNNGTTSPTVTNTNGNYDPNKDPKLIEQNTVRIVLEQNIRQDSASIVETAIRAVQNNGQFRNIVIGTVDPVARY